MSPTNGHDNMINPASTAVKIEHGGISSLLSPVAEALSKAVYHLETVYFLTYADLHQFILPTLAFGFATSLSPALIRHDPLIPPLDRLTLTLSNTPIALTWIWINDIIFDLENQRHPEAVREDKVNKPWRPIPSGRLTPENARRCTLYLLPCVIALNYSLGAGSETPGMYLLLWMYNDLGGSEEHWVIRNAINAIGYVWCSIGIVSVMRKGEEGSDGLSLMGCQWCGIICAVIWSTMHIQDLRDRDGDRLVGRKTMPLVYGDTAARWSVISAMAGWVCVCCGFWSSGFKVWVMEASITAFIGSRLLRKKDALADSKTYNFWGLWLGSLYMLPVYQELCALI